MLYEKIYTTVKRNLDETGESFITFENSINESSTILKSKIVKHSLNNFSYKLIGVYHQKKERKIKIIMEKENANSEELKEFLNNLLFFGNIRTISFCESHY